METKDIILVVGGIILTIIAGIKRAIEKNKK